jgi:hypothetical protein
MSEKPKQAVTDGAKESGSVDFFSRTYAPQEEIIEGILREGQIATLGGDYGMGKTPLLQDWVADLINGVTWCGRNVRRRPVIHLDFESNPSTFSESIRRICTQRDILLPRAPSFRPFLYLSDPKLPDTKELFEAIEGPTEKRFQWLDKLLSSTPDAVVIVDPFDMLFCIDLSKAPTWCRCIATSERSWQSTQKLRLC